MCRGIKNTRGEAFIRWIGDFSGIFKTQRQEARLEEAEVLEMETSFT